TGERQAHGHGQDHPVVATGRGGAFLGGGDGVAEPAQAPDVLAALVGQGVVYQQGDPAADVEAGEGEQGGAVGPAGHRPRRALEEVVGGVQAVALAGVAEGLGSSAVGDAAEAVLAQAQDPAEEEPAVGLERGAGEGGGKGLDKGLQGSYHGPHGGSSRASAWL